MFPKNEIKSINSFLLDKKPKTEETADIYNLWIQSSSYQPDNGEAAILFFNYIDKMKSCPSELLEKLNNI